MQFNWIDLQTNPSRKLRVEVISDRGTWERFWQNQGPHALFQSWLWGEVIKRQSLPLARFGLYAGSHLVGIFQVVTIRARRGTYLHLRHGPMLIAQKEPYWRSVLTSLRALAHEQRAWFLRMSPQIDDAPEHRALFRSLGFVPSVVHEVDAERCLLLSIDHTEDELLSAMRKTTRYEIRRAQKLGVRVVGSTDPKDFDTFWDLYQKTSRRQHFVAHRGTREEFELYAKEGKAVLLLGYQQDALLAGAIILFSGNEAIYHHGASIPTKLPVNYALQWEAIREAKRRGVRIYNFWGIAPGDRENHPWHGITVFKKGFGGNEVRTIHAHDLPLSPRYWLTRGIERWEERLRGY